MVQLAFSQPSDVWAMGSNLGGVTRDGTVSHKIAHANNMESEIFRVCESKLLRGLPRVRVTPTGASKHNKGCKD